MKNTQLLKTLVFIFFLCGCGSVDERNAEVDKQQADSALAAPPPRTAESFSDSTQITGLLQTSGLQSHEAEALGLSHGHYQLLSQNNYFLEGHDSLKLYLGQCVLLSGREKGWEEKGVSQAEQHTYNRKVFVVEEVQPLIYSRCHFSDTLAAQPQGREVVYTGRIERRQRPAPDIAYDYQLRLENPYRDANHPIEPGKLVETLPLITDSFEILYELETAVRQNHILQFKGLQQQGYAEQEAVWVLSVDNLQL